MSLPPTPPTLPPIQINVGYLYHLLFGWDEHWGEPMLSWYQHGEDLFCRPLRVPLELGQLIKKHDPEQRLMVVHLYDDHAEIWRADQWANSESKRYLAAQIRTAGIARWQAQNAERAAELTEIKRAREVLIKHFPIMDYSDSKTVIELARTIIKAPPEFVTKFPILAPVYNEYHSTKSN